jgi:hypothetical protein
VIGKDVPFLLLEAIAEEPEERLREGLARLQAAEFVYEARLFPELEYTFKHALTHEVTYGGMLQDRRSALHARILEAMERLPADHHLATATTMYREMGMTYWREKAEAEMTELGDRMPR